LPSLIAALKSISNPSIQCRACRLLGNLAEHKEIISHIQDLKPAYAICSLLDGQNGIPVLLMAVRATRILWDDKKFQDECISLGAVKKIIQLLVKFTLNPNANDETSEDDADNFEAETVVIKRMHSPDRTVTKQKFKRIINDIENSRSDITGYEIVKNNTLQINAKKFIMPAQKDVTDLFTGILKFLQMITMRISVQIAYQLFGDGDGYACLMFLCSEDGSKFRSVSLKVLANLSSNSAARPELSKCDAVIVAANLLMSKERKEQLDGVDKR
jgi:armadillo repeat-containing protein 5